jgi:hypothetical protein
MYVYYEHHKDANGKILLTELRLSSKPNGRLEINFKDPMEETIFNACKAVLKWPPLANYSYDPAIKCWSYFGQYGVSSTYGVVVIEKLSAICLALQTTFEAFPIQDLTSQALNNSVNMSSFSASHFKVEDFFYQKEPAQLGGSTLSKAEIEQKLTALIGSAPDKKSYRQAALRFHPDRNNGDGSKMSELNMLWQQWQKEVETLNVSL